VRLHYTRRAAAELEQILSYIEERSPVGARRVHLRIQAAIQVLLQHPDAGTVTSKGRLRRMLASPFPYVILYQATDDEVIIHGIRHTARDPSSMPGSKKGTPMNDEGGPT
jgi:toxin ParE1/3/4